MVIKAIFFDIHGTLWYPKDTKNREHTALPYKKYGQGPELIKHMKLTPYARPTLLKLKKMGILLFAVTSAPNHKAAIRDGRVDTRLKHLKLNGIFDKVAVVGTKGDVKGPVILKTLKRLKIPKSQALMVGDAYWTDYRLVKKNGIKCILFYSEFQRRAWPHAKRVKNTIKSLSELFKYLN